MIAWTLAGVDSGGGAGIAADLRTFGFLGVHGCSVVTALTAQNSTEVTGVAHPTGAMVTAQIEALRSDMPPTVIKTGMLGDAEVVRALIDGLKEVDAPLICDPVLVSSSGQRLLTSEGRSLLYHELLPRVTLLTPNRSEVMALTGISAGYEIECLKRTGATFRKLGVKALLVTGGSEAGAHCIDYFDDGTRHFFLVSKTVKTPHGHGTGCTLASAIAAYTARGETLPDAVVLAKAYVIQGLLRARAVGAGPGPVVQGPPPEDPACMPWIPGPAEKPYRDRLEFPTTGPRPLGFYPIVDQTALLRRLLGTGITTVQLRIKDASEEAIDAAVAEAVALTRAADCRLFVNDHWQAAVRHGAYGVHLGQEDLEDADIPAIHAAGLRLGISCHGAWEAARAMAYNPSYIAMGPVYATDTKQVAARPRGTDHLAHWCRMLPTPVVAIGGISLARAPEVLAAGVDGIAVISAITAAPDPEAAARAWCALMHEAKA